MYMYHVPESAVVKAIMLMEKAVHSAFLGNSIFRGKYIKIYLFWTWGNNFYLNIGENH
jgi:hypothetical protein